VAFGFGQEAGKLGFVVLFKGLAHLQNDLICLVWGICLAHCRGCEGENQDGSPKRCQNLCQLHEWIMDKSEAKKRIRQDLLAARLNMPDRQERIDALQRVMRIWLFGRPEMVIGAYWPIKGEFDPLPALHRWKEDGELTGESQLRRIGLPVVDKVHKTLTFHAWYPGCPMEEDAYGIPKPKDTEVIVPTLLFVPCVGYTAGGFRLGYGGGFYDRTLASLKPKPLTVGLGFKQGYVDDFEPEPHDVPLDAILNDNGVVWPVG
jgi:5,10-methenyltetrahydrofolate synthetase